MKLAFFDAKPYDRPGFDAHAAGTGLEIRYFETKLGEDTVQLARGFDGVCWVPVSKKRRKSRGYDQSELLAKRVAKDLSLPTCAALQKHAERNPQSQLKDAALRQANASGAFSVRPDADVSGKTLLLIDDIVTTGATLSECCRMLRQAGAKHIYCAAFASPRKEKER